MFLILTATSLDFRTSQLCQACPDFRNPETVRLVQQCLQYRRYVRPCGQWKEWKKLVGDGGWLVYSLNFGIILWLIMKDQTLVSKPFGIH